MFTGRSRGIESQRKNAVTFRHDMQYALFRELKETICITLWVTSHLLARLKLDLWIKYFVNYITFIARRLFTLLFHVAAEYILYTNTCVFYVGERAFNIFSSYWPVKPLDRKLKS